MNKIIKIMICGIFGAVVSFALNFIGLIGSWSGRGSSVLVYILAWFTHMNCRIVRLFGADCTMHWIVSIVIGFVIGIIVGTKLNKFEKEGETVCCQKIK